MATYKPRTAFNKALGYVKNMPLRDVQLPILDQISKMMWLYAPWRWTLDALPVVPLTSSTQDYVVALPSDFLYATDAYLADGNNQYDTLLVEPALPSNVKVIGRPKRIAVTGTPGENGTLRTSTITGTFTATPPSIISLYKKAAPTLTLPNLHTAGVLVFPDDWAWVYEEGVLWQTYVWAEDVRAGTVQVGAQGQAQYTGQRAAFEDGLAKMKDREKLPENEPVAKQETRKTRG